MAEVEDKPYKTYDLKVDPEQDDRATELKLWKFGRPHMRGFHLAWLGFFVAFFLWFAIAPLQTEVKKSLKLTKQQLWNASIVGVTGTVFMRFLVGPLVDKYGPRIAMAIILVVASIPTGMTGLIKSGSGLVVLRLFIGISGSTFVACQYWCSRMFAKEIVGTANAIAAGWGNLGGGVTQLVMGSLLFPLFKYFYRGYNLKTRATKAWRTVCIVPAFLAMCTAVMVYFLGEDCPKGNYAEMKKKGIMAEVSAAKSFRSGALNFNTWWMAIQYACCFGVELTMYNAAALYYTDKFGKSTESAAAIASIFGWFNVFSRGAGGLISDIAMAKLGMRGRLWVQTFFLLVEGALVIVFAHMDTLGGSIAVMCVFGIFVQGCAGTTFGIVPYVDPSNTGALSGIVGAGGNIGAVAFGLMFKYFNYKKAFIAMGATILASSVFSALVFIPGHAGLLFGEDDPSKQQHKNKTLTIPEKQLEVDEEEEAEEA